MIHFSTSPAYDVIHSEYLGDDDDIKPSHTVLAVVFRFSHEDTYTTDEFINCSVMITYY